MSVSAILKNDCMAKLLRMILFGTVIPLLAATEIASATVIAARTGAVSSNFNGNPVQAAQWTLTGSFTDVSIAATIARGSGAGNGTFYLTNAFGPGATSANEIARISLVNVPDATGSIPPPTLLFSGLNLGPGTYFLIEANDVAPFGIGWLASNASSEIDTAGTTIGADRYTVSLAGYAPATPNFTLGLHEFLFSVQGNAANALGDASNLVYKPLEPCRIMDTRSATLASGVRGPIAGNSLKTLPGFITAGQNWGQYGGNAASDCGLADPPGASISAVALVATILNPNFDAYLGISDVNDLSTVLTNVALNYTAHQGLSTMYLVPQIASNNIYFAMPTGLSAQLIFDVVGYYVLSDATALQCTSASSAPAAIGAGASASATSPACAVGYTLTSGNCHSDATSLRLVADKASGQTWACTAFNSGGASANLTATVNCCRLGGK
jgi:hypothetical protein